MGMGTLRRIAVLCALATCAVLAAGGASGLAQLSLPSTQVQVPSTSVTVPSTSVTVPTTKTTVTTPKVTVTTPPAPAPKPSSPAPSAPKSPTKTVVDTVDKTVKDTTGTVKGVTGGGSGGSSGGSSGGTSGGGGGTLDSAVRDTTGTVGTVTDRLTGTRSGSGSGLLGSTLGGSTAGGAAGQLQSPFAPAPGGGQGGFAFLAAGPGGGGGGSGAAGGHGGGSLYAALAGASAHQLRAALMELQGCLPTLAPIDRRVLKMRAGLGGRALSRSQVASRLDISRRSVAAAERRGLMRLDVAAQTTGCASAYVSPFDPAGIGNLTAQFVLGGPVPARASAPGDFSDTRGIAARSAEPLFQFGGGSGNAGPAWAIILFTILLSVSLAALMRELRSSF